MPGALKAASEYECTSTGCRHKKNAFDTKMVCCTYWN